MTDREIIQGLIARDNRVTEQFFYVRCRPLLKSIMRLVFGRPVEYDEMVSELYDYLMTDDCSKLRRFQYRSSIYQWMKVVATRFFIRHRDRMIENASNELPYVREADNEAVDTADIISDRIDVAKLLRLMDNRRYADVIQNLVLDDVAPERYALQIGVTVDNLYNIKKRAMTALSRIALKYYGHGR